MNEESPRFYRYNHVGIRIMTPPRPAETFCCVFDGIDPIGTRGKSLKFRRAAVPSRFKTTDSQ